MEHERTHKFFTHRAAVEPTPNKCTAHIYLSTCKRLNKMATRRKNTGQGARLDSQSKEMLLNVYTYFKRLQSKTRSKGAFERTLEATRVSSYALCKVIKEGKKEASFSSPKKRYKSTRERVNTRTDSFDRDAIRRKMYEIYEKKEHITLTSLLVCCVWM